MGSLEPKEGCVGYTLRTFQQFQGDWKLREICWLSVDWRCIGRGVKISCVCIQTRLRVPSERWGGWGWGCHLPHAREPQLHEDSDLVQSQATSLLTLSVPGPSSRNATSKEAKPTTTGWPSACLAKPCVHFHCPSSRSGISGC